MIIFFFIKLRLSNTKEQVISCLRNDFNTSQALLCITDFIDEVNKSLPVINISSSVIPTSILVIARCYFYVNNILDTLGVNLLSKKVSSLLNVFM